jgi:hypothetical protein
VSARENPGSVVSDFRQLHTAANGKLLDVRLRVRCVSCDRTSKITVHERAPVSCFDPAELDGYHPGDPHLVASTLLDPLLPRRNRFTLDWKEAWRDTPAEETVMAGD